MKAAVSCVHASTLHPGRQGEILFPKHTNKQTNKRVPGITHACNPSTLGGRGGQITWGWGVWDQPDQRGETPSLLKIQNQLGVVAHACNPSYLGGWGRRTAWTWKAELQWAEITPLHSNLGDRARLHLIKKDKQTKQLSLYAWMHFWMSILFHWSIYLSNWY